MSRGPLDCRSGRSECHAAGSRGIVSECFWTPGSDRVSPVYPVKHVSQLRRCDRDRPVSRQRLYEPAALQPLGVQRHANPVMPENLDQVSAVPAEHIEVAGVRIASQSFLNLEHVGMPTDNHTRTPEGTGITAAPDASTTAAAKAGDTEAGIRTRGLPANSISNHRRWRWWVNAIAGRCHQHARKAIDRRSQLPAPTIDQTRCHVVLTRYVAHHCAGRKPLRDDRPLRLAAPPAPTVTRHVEGLLDACADAPRDHVTGVTG